MSQIIAGVYELEKQIGAGGGGIVYLGRHLRLNKKVVLKADKRTLSTKTEVLRREVDMLKGLSHTYIPQVYDFVQENGVVYTVMDFIEGESLDKLLGRHETLTQPQIIGWACQLLEALSYLHSRPPHGILHADIKPANIMLRPNGDICLIDYNIALALNEDGAVKVGFSRGYASPEHYGMDYIRSSVGAGTYRKTEPKLPLQNKPAAASEQQGEEAVLETELMSAKENMADTEAAETELMTGAGDDGGAFFGFREQKTGSDSSMSRSDTGSQTAGRAGVLLDARSDIYSLGATLYHLFSGRKPAHQASEVEPLGKEVCSPAVSAILQKAMEPDPEKRYQSADEMLTAFRQLHRKDPRWLRHKRRELCSGVVLSVLFLAGGMSTFVGLKQMERQQAALTLAEYSANEYEAGNISEAVALAMQALSQEKGFLPTKPSAQAQKALTDALGVYDLSDGFKALDVLKLPSAPFELVVSPEGTRFAARCAEQALVYELKEQTKQTELPMPASALADLVFINETQVIYAGVQGVTAYDLETEKELWTGEAATVLSVSGDGSTLAALNEAKDGVTVYRIGDGSRLRERSFGEYRLDLPVNDRFADAGNYLFSLNEDGSLLAVSFAGGGLMLLDLDNPDEDLIIFEESEYNCFQGGFCSTYFAFTAEANGSSQFGLIDSEQAIYLGGYDSRNPLLLSVNAEGIYLAEETVLIKLDPETFEQTELAYTDPVRITGFSVTEDYTMVVTEEEEISFYDRGANRITTEQRKTGTAFACLAGDFALLANRDEPQVQLMQAENHKAEQLFAYDPAELHDEARISQDEQTVMLFDYQHFTIYDRNGSVAAKENLPDPESIYDQQFHRTEAGSWLEVIWYDGTVRLYRASDGTLLEEKREEPPQKDLYEEFLTASYRITSSLHQAPVVFARDTGKQAAVLESEDYLTYVTQEGDYLITEYVSSEGERYGLLLDENLQILAELPKLCDVINGTLIFDDESGNLRQSRLYSLQELTALGENDK